MAAYTTNSFQLLHSKTRVIDGAEENWMKYGSRIALLEYGGTVTPYIGGPRRNLSPGPCTAATDGPPGPYIVATGGPSAPWMVPLEIMIYRNSSKNSAG